MCDAVWQRRAGVGPRGRAHRELRSLQRWWLSDDWRAVSLRGRAALRACAYAQAMLALVVSLSGCGLAHERAEVDSSHPVDSGAGDVGRRDDAAAFADASIRPDVGLDAPAVDAGFDTDPCTTHPGDDRMNCGGCGNVCGVNAACVDGMCVRERILDVGVGFAGVCVVLESHRLLCWGRNLCDIVTPHTSPAPWRCGDTTPTPFLVPTEVSGVPPALEVETTGQDVHVLTPDGMLIGWGWNAYGDVDGLPTEFYHPFAVSPRPVIAEGPFFAFVNAGEFEEAYCALHGDRHHVYCWGRDFRGAPRLSGGWDTELPSRVEAIEVSGYLAGAILDDGSVWTWGRRADPSGTAWDGAEPHTVDLGQPALDLSCEETACWVVLADHTVWGWPSSPDETQPFRPRPLGVSGVRTVHRARSSVSFALCAWFLDGTVSCREDYRDPSTERVIAFAGPVTAVYYAPGAESICARIGDDRLQCVSDNLFFVPGDGSPAHVVVEPVAPLGFE